MKTDHTIRLGFANEQHGGDIYFCEPSPGLGIAVWYRPATATSDAHYFIVAFPKVEPSLERSWLNTVVAPAGVRRGRSVAPDLAVVATTIKTLTNDYERMQSYERSLAA